MNLNITFLISSSIDRNTKVFTIFFSSNDQCYEGYNNGVGSVNFLYGNQRFNLLSVCSPYLIPSLILSNTSVAAIMLKIPPLIPSHDKHIILQKRVKSWLIA